MPSFPIRERLVPYRILAYLLYAPTEALDWLESTSTDEVCLYTPQAASALNMRIYDIRQAISWLEEQDLVRDVNREVRGQLRIRLIPPTNIEQAI